MAPIEIMNDLFFIERGYLNGNHFVYRSKDPVLIDTGYISDFDLTAESIKSLGVSISDVRLIITTHCHSDHVGGNKIIQERSGCDIALHRFGKHFMDTKDDWATWWKYFGQDADFFDPTKALEDGDGETAEPLLEQAARYEPDQPDILNNLAAAYSLQGRHGEAESLIRQIHSRFPDYLFGRTAMAQLLARDDRIDEAKTYLKHQNPAHAQTQKKTTP